MPQPTCAAGAAAVARPPQPCSSPSTACRVALSSTCRQLRSFVSDWPEMYSELSIDLAALRSSKSLLRFVAAHGASLRRVVITQPGHWVKAPKPACQEFLEALLIVLSSCSPHLELVHLQCGSALAMPAGRLAQCTGKCLSRRGRRTMWLGWLGA